METKNRVFSKKVKDIIQEAALLYSKRSAFHYACDLEKEIERFNVRSPIEQAFLVGFLVVQEFTIPNLIRSTKKEPDGTEQEIKDGFEIIPQFRVDNYRVDFALSHYKGGEGKTVLVECDSQEFHDRSEAERRYEKQRDRALQAAGFKVFRFTGTEILKDPFEVAAEIIGFVTRNNSLTTEYSPDF